MVAKLPKDYAEADSISQHSIHSEARGASIIQVETVGKGLLVIVIAMLTVALIASIASIFWAASAAKEAARAAERADVAQRDAAISELYATQVYTELARLGIQVKSPADFDHTIQQEE